MKNCAYCKIEVGGNLTRCPVCQTKLRGEDERAYFPSQMILKITSLFYKVQLFIVWTVIILTLGLDFLFDMTVPMVRGIHWSLLLAMWLIALEFGLIRLFQKNFSASRVFTLFVFILLGLLTVTAYFIEGNYFDLMLEWIIPYAINGTLIVNFIFVLIDRSGNSMIYLLTNLVVGILPYVVLYFLGRDCPFAWIECLIISVILLVGAIIFRGRAVLGEIHRRLNV